MAIYSKKNRRTTEVHQGGMHPPLLQKDNDAGEQVRHWRLSCGDKPTRGGTQSTIRVCNDIRRQLRNEFIYPLIRVISKSFTEDKQVHVLVVFVLPCNLRF